MYQIRIKDFYLKDIDYIMQLTGEILILSYEMVNSRSNAKFFGDYNLVLTIAPKIGGIIIKYESKEV